MMAFSNFTCMLVLKSQDSAVAEILKKPKFSGAPLARPMHTFYSVCHLTMGLAKTQLCATANIEEAGFRSFRYVNRKFHILGSSPSPGPHKRFLLLGFYDGPWQTAAACQI